MLQMDQTVFSWVPVMNRILLCHVQCRGNVRNLWELTPLDSFMLILRVTWVSLNQREVPRISGQVQR